MTNRIPARLGPSTSRWLAGAFVACALVLVPGGSAQAAPGDPPTLTLVPSAGPPGSQATATLAGFDACKPAEGADTRQVILRWDDGTDVGSAQLDAGAAAVELQVPGRATLGPHEVLAFCNSNPQVRATAGFSVAPPVVQPVRVPDVTSVSVGEASQRLKDAGLVLGRVTGSGDVVGKQDPAANGEVPPGSPVDIELAAKAAQQVAVPSLIGLSVDDARVALTDVGLVLGDVAGDGGVIRSQDPGPQSLVPVGSGVAVSVDAAVPARGPDRGPPVLPLVLAGLAGAGLLAIGYRVIRARRAKSWTRNHVKVAPEDVAAVGSSMAPAGHGPPGDVAVRIDRHIDAGEHRLEEISR